MSSSQSYECLSSMMLMHGHVRFPNKWETTVVETMQISTQGRDPDPRDRTESPEVNS